MIITITDVNPLRTIWFLKFFYDCRPPDYVNLAYGRIWEVGKK